MFNSFKRAPKSCKGQKNTFRVSSGTIFDLGGCPTKNPIAIYEKFTMFLSLYGV